MTSQNKPDATSKKTIVWFDELSTKEVKKRAKANTVVIIPIGSVEAHGDHLPLCTDSLQPEYVALEVAKRTKCLVAPPLRYGVCDTTRNFPGTLSIGFQSLFGIVKDIGEELVRNGFRRILVLSGHAEKLHMAALRLAVQEIVWKHAGEKPEICPRIMVCSDYDFAYELRGKCFSEKDGHAGTIETSRVLSIRPDLIKAKGNKSYHEFNRFEIIAEPEKYFPTGVIGDPTAATPRKGQEINEYILENVVRLVEELMR